MIGLDLFGRRLRALARLLAKVLSRLPRLFFQSNLSGLGLLGFALLRQLAFPRVLLVLLLMPVIGHISTPPGYLEKTEGIQGHFPVERSDHGRLALLERLSEDGSGQRLPLALVGVGARPRPVFLLGGPARSQIPVVFTGQLGRLLRGLVVSQAHVDRGYMQSLTVDSGTRLLRAR
jgi:hypothetical protein